MRNVPISQVNNMASHLRPQGTEPSDDEAFIFSLIGKIQKYDQYIAKNLDQDTLGSLKNEEGQVFFETQARSMYLETARALAKQWDLEIPQTDNYEEISATLTALREKPLKIRINIKKL